jgi:hypothetical protein
VVCQEDPAHRPLISFPVVATSSTGHPMGFDKIRELSELWAGRPHSRLHGRSWEQVVEQANQSNDLETVSRLDIVQTYGARLDGLLEVLAAQSRPSHDPGVRYVFSTVHKFKGLEEETVRLLGSGSIFRFVGTCRAEIY